MTRPDRSLPRRQAPPLSREANDRTNGRPVSMSRTTLGGRGSPDKKAADDPGSRSGRYRSETSLCAASGSGYRPGAAPPADSRLRATVGARRPSWLVPRGGRPAGRPPRLRFPRGPRSAVRVLAGLSSAFPRPSSGRSAGRGNAFPVSLFGCRRHPGFWPGYSATSESSGCCGAVGAVSRALSFSKATRRTKLLKEI